MTLDAFRLPQLGYDRFLIMVARMTSPTARRTPGRPRAFSEEKVLNQAIRLFSASGYTATGISELSKATRLTAGSLYKAYQDKEGIFVKALGCYIEQRETELAALLDVAANSREAVAILLKYYARLSQGEEGKLGCLIVSGINELPQFSAAADVLRKQLRRRHTLLTSLVEQGIAEGSIATPCDAAVIADLLLTLLYGMRVIGKAQAFSSDADAFVAQALKMLD